MAVEPFRVVSADPAWPFGDKLPGKKRGAVKNYGLTTIADLCAFKLPPIADDAYLFLWRVAAMVEEAYQVGRAWGFVPKSEIVWQKTTKEGKPWFGMGRHVRASHEIAILFTRGRPKPLLRNIRSRFSAPVPVDAAGKYIHSGKPEHFYKLVEALAPGPYVELFARARRPGWSTRGNEVHLGIKDQLR